MNEALHALGHLPGVGPSIADKLWAIGGRSAAEIAHSDPQALYDRLCDYEGVRVDRCVLYVFRCAVHVARTGEEGCRWWDFTDDRRGPDVSALP